MLERGPAAGARRQRERAAAAGRPLLLARPGRATPTTRTEAIYAINCLDDPTSIAGDEVPRPTPRLRGGVADLRPDLRLVAHHVQRLPVRSSEEPLDIRGEGAAPILVVGTTRDPATPLKWAEALAEQLESGVLLRRDGDGHTAYNSGNECVDTAIEDYLLDGDVPADPTDC